MAFGLALGLLIGIISGTVFLLLLKTAVSASNQGISSVVTLTAELLAMPTFWFGGPWLTTELLKLVPMQELLNPMSDPWPLPFASSRSTRLRAGSCSLARILEIDAGSGCLPPQH